MNEQKTTGAHDHLLRMILMIAACFAIGSIGFFLAVVLQHTTQAPTAAAAIPSLQVKENAMQSLAASRQSASASTTSGQDSTTTAAGAGSSSPVSPTQADSSDQSAAAKLQVLENLNSQ